MKILAAVLLFLCSALTIAGQQGCNLNEAPPVLGLRLHMSPEQARAAVGKNIKIKVRSAAQKTIFQNYIKKPPPPALAGVRAVYLRFFNRRLYQIEVFYEEKSRIRSLADFTAMLADKFEFSSFVWQERVIDSIIDCGDFTVVADNVLNPRVEITDEIARRAVEIVRKKRK